MTNPMKKYLVVTSLLLFMSLLAHAQTAYTSINTAYTSINKDDVDRFIKTYEPMAAEFEALGEEYEDVDMSAMGVMVANEKVKSILEKYGWGEEMSSKWMTITVAYSLVKVDEQLAAMTPQERKQMESVVGQNLFGSVEISEEDKQIVKARMSELDEIFDN